MLGRNKNEVAKKGSNEVSVDIEMFNGHATGFEGTSSETFKMPFMKILQSLSPELQETKPEYNPEAKKGQFCNSATGELYDSLSVVVLKIEHALVVWKPEREGFVGRHHKSEENKVVARRDGLEKWDEHGNEVVDSVEFYLMNAKDPADIFILSLSKALMKHGRSFATRIRTIKSNGKSVNVTWAGIWKISTVLDSNEKGQWYTIGSTPEFERFITIENRDDAIVPAIEVLSKAEVDYSVTEEGRSGSSSEDDIAY